MSTTGTGSTPSQERLPAAASQPAAAPQAAVPPAVAPQPQKRCLDCGAPLEGKYCIACGQRAQLRSLSLPSLAHDAIHDLAQFDSRVWRTLRALLLRPGFLTNEFLQGRRTRFLPPFRLYLVLSLIFFVLLSCAPSEDALVVALDSSDPGGARSKVVTGANPEALRQAMEELGRELGGEAASDPAAQTAAKTAAAISQAAMDPDSSMVTDNACSVTWGLAGRDWFEPRIRRVCENLKTVSKRQFGRELFRNVPKMMFLFLPLLAIVNLVLYAFRRRKYVEHLLFYVHFHAFAFLLLTLQILLGVALNGVGLGSIAGIVTAAAVIYLFVALFIGMRAVYGQSRTMTTFKYIAVLSAYGVFSLLTFMGTLLYTAMTV